MKQAIFLTGGPGSGKDLLIKRVFEHHNFSEYNIDQIKEKKFYTENIIVVGNSYDLDKIIRTKSILEKCYYDVSMIYVNVSESVSIDRLSGRLTDAQIIKEKLRISEENLDVFGRIFNNFFIFENSFSSNSEEIREQIEWINGEVENLTESALEKFKKKIKKKNTDVSYDPLPASKDGINPTYDTRAAGNGDLIKNYESLDPMPLEQGIGMGSNHGNQSNQEPMLSLKDTSYDKSVPKQKIFGRIKKILAKNKNA